MNKLIKIRREVFYFFLLTFSFLLFSCIPQKRIVYLQSKDEAIKKEFVTPNEKYKIKPGDELYIRVLSLDDKTSEVFNSMIGNRMMQQNLASGGAYLTSFTVNDSGTVDFPYVGAIYVIDKNVEEVKTEILNELSQYLKYITVVVKLVNFKVSVVGEVNNPGHFDVFNDEITFFEALGLAGDLTEYGNRNTITLIRKTENGEKVVKIDITDQNFLSSEYYYLMPNDVIYVAPLGAKPFGLAKFKLTEYIQVLASMVTLILSYNTYILNKK